MAQDFQKPSFAVENGRPVRFYLRGYSISGRMFSVVNKRSALVRVNSATFRIPLIALQAEGR